MGDKMAKSVKKRRGRPSLSEAGSKDSKMIGIVTTGDLRKRIAKWAAKQSDKPTQSEAARRLLNLALTSAGY
jgi:hypothetical protein